MAKKTMKVETAPDPESFTSKLQKELAETTKLQDENEALRDELETLKEKLKGVQKSRTELEAQLVTFMDDTDSFVFADMEKLHQMHATLEFSTGLHGARKITFTGGRSHASLKRTFDSAKKLVEFLRQ